MKQIENVLSLFRPCLTLINLIHQQYTTFTMPYVKKEHEQDIINFKYKGGTASLTYEYLWSPFAEFLLQFTPVWLAPNTITLIAFLAVVFSHIVFISGREFGQDVHPGLLIMFGCTILFYQHLDNLDGKQARKTKSSSPIGMLFDHGADALTGMLFALQICSVIQMRNGEHCIYYIAIIIMIPNFAGLWMQYSVGEFKLDRINPIDEGLPTYAIFAILSGVFRWDFWNTFHIWNTYNEEFLLVFSIIVVVIIVNMCKNILSDSKRNRADVLSKLLLPAILLLSLLVIKLFNCTFIYTLEFYPFFYTLVFFWGRSMMLMQVSHVANQVFPVFNRGTVFYIVSLTGFIALHPILGPYTHAYLLTTCIIQGLILGEFIISFLSQAKQILKIELFSIKPVKQE